VFKAFHQEVSDPYLKEFEDWIGEKEAKVEG